MKELVYYPSLSSGGFASWLKKDKEVAPGIPARFYSPEFPEPWRHEYFLITAGHHYKKPESRKEYGLGDNVKVMGDSGGFQLATGAIKWKPEFKETIFHWLENNCDIGVNLDIPPRVKYEGKFYECLDISYENFKYFADNQSGKCDFLNVIQGNNLAEYEYWYKKVADFNFNGWCIGGTQSGLVLLMQAIAVMLQNGEFDKERNRYIHILGISKVSDFFILAYFQKMINEYYGGRIQISTDSSSPGQYPVYGIYLHSPQLGKMVFNQLHFPKGDALPYKETDPVPNPYGHPVAEGFTFGDVAKYDASCMNKMTINNLIVYNETVRQVTELVKCHDELISLMLPNEFYRAMTSMREMFAHPDKAYEIYEKSLPLYKKYSSTQEISNDSVLNHFFNVT
jgi:hypothetical protein